MLAVFLIWVKQLSATDEADGLKKTGNAAISWQRSQYASNYTKEQLPCQGLFYYTIPYKTIDYM
jgi:hypothetical protein